MTNLTKEVDRLTNEVAYLKRIENITNIVFGSIFTVGMIFVVIVCPLMMQMN